MHKLVHYAMNTSNHPNLLNLLLPGAAHFLFLYDKLMMCLLPLPSSTYPALSILSWICCGSLPSTHVYTRLISDTLVAFYQGVAFLYLSKCCFDHYVVITFIFEFISST